MNKLIRVRDFETTGKEPTDQVVEMGWCDLFDDGSGWQIGGHGAQLYFVPEIGPEVRAVHHIKAADVAHCQPFSAEAMWATDAADGVALVASHFTEFDGQFWGAPQLPVLCTLKAALRVWPDAPAHNNGTLRYWLEDQGLIAPDDACTYPPHRAGPDAYVTAWILKALLTEATANQMVAWTKEPRLMPRCSIGKFRGKPWSEVETGFLTWMLNQADMEADLKWNASRELDRRRDLAA